MKHLLTFALAAALMLSAYVGTYYWTVGRFKCGMSPPDSPCYPTYSVFGYGLVGQAAKCAFTPMHDFDRRARSEYWNVVPNDELRDDQ